jgi:hypothetical protein
MTIQMFLWYNNPEDVNIQTNLILQISFTQAKFAGFHGRVLVTTEIGCVAAPHDVVL